MKKIAIYPGTFDPITYGHIDVIKKALKIVDNIIVAISNGNQKNYLFTAEERIEIVKQALFKDLKLNKKVIMVISFNSLTTDLCKKYKSKIILRGLRAASDFEYEFQMTGMNFKLNSSIETIFLMASDNNQLISSNLVKEVCKLKGDISRFVPKEVETQSSKEDLQRLEKALNFSNTMKTFNLNKNNLKIKTQNLLSYSTAGGSFTVNQSLISFMNFVVSSGKTEISLLDKNDIPIHIEDTEKFLDEVSSLYFEVVNDYYNEYQQLRSSRKIEKVLEI